MLEKPAATTATTHPSGQPAGARTELVRLDDGGLAVRVFRGGAPAVDLDLRGLTDAGRRP
jgi:hypothetical protein